MSDVDYRNHVNCEIHEIYYVMTDSRPPRISYDTLMYETAKLLIRESMSNVKSEKVVSVSSRGQATIPKEFREELGIDTPGRVKFVRTDEGDIVVRPIHSVKDLRGVLQGKTDEQGRSAVERLREERERDKASEEELRQRYVDDDETAS
jgi:antitoxin PrlF